MFELRALRYFVGIAEARSFSQAACHLHVAQPSLTRQIHNLEQELGAALFVRLSRGVTLTEAGELLLDHAKGLLRDVERSYAAVRAHGADPSGQVLLGLPPTLGPVLLPALVTQLRHQYPRVVLDVVPSRNISIAEWLRAGRVDVAIMAQVSAEPDILTTQVAREEMVLLTGPNVRSGSFVSPQELASLPVTGTKSLLAIADDLLRGRGVHLNVDLVLNNLDAIRAMVRQSIACSVFPYAFIQADHQAGLVAAHRILRGGLHRQLAIGVSASRTQTAAMQAVVRLCQTIMADIQAAAGFKLAR